MLNSYLVEMKSRFTNYLMSLETTQTKDLWAPPAGFKIL